MNISASSSGSGRRELPKTPTGIVGLDEITGGGLPSGRTTLVGGSAGCGKTLFAAEFLVRGATQFGEPGVFMAFEETAEELAQNVGSLGFDLDQLIAERKILVDHVRIERSEIDETGEYDLQALFIRLGHAIDSVGAKRVVLDTLEALFAGLDNAGIIRAELRRLFRWMKDRGVTAIVTAERGDRTLTRHGLEEFVSDCVILLDHRVSAEVSTRRLRIVKYRGTTHGTNEYPFLIDENGLSVVPVTSLELRHKASSERIGSGIARLDTMLGGGVYRGASVLISGTAGVGKTSLCAHFAQAACNRGERCLLFAFEESPSQLVRNMRSIGVDLQRWIDAGLLHVHAQRPTMAGLEMHLARMHRLIREFDPALVIVDPVSNLPTSGTETEAGLMLMRLIDFLKSRQTTAVFTNLTAGGTPLEVTELGISSLIDTWILVRDIELGGERNRALYVLKSRGTAHSNQIREFLLTPQGIELRDVYVGLDGVLTGSMRTAQEAREGAMEQQRNLEIERRRAELEAQIAALKSQADLRQEDLRRLLAEHDQAHERDALARQQLAMSRRADVAQTPTGKTP